MTTATRCTWAEFVYLVDEGLNLVPLGEHSLDSRGWN